MYWDVKTARPMDDYKIYVELIDGRKGIFDLKPYLNHGVFRELKNKSYFSQVDIMFGAVTWPHKQDIAPETLVAGLKPIEYEGNAEPSSEMEQPGSCHLAAILQINFFHILAKLSANPGCH